VWRYGIIFGCCLVGARVALAQATAPSTRPAQDALVTLDFPADGVELRTLAEIVTKRLGIPIIFDESINAKKVILRVPRQVPESALLGILQSALRMKQMALVDADIPGWKQIVPATNLAAISRPSTGPVVEGTAITQVITLKRADPSRVVEAVRSLLTQPGGNLQPVPGQKMLIVSDYPNVVRRIDEVAKLLDSDLPNVQTKFVPLKEAEAAAIASAVSQLLSSKDNFLFGGATSGIFITPDERTNQIVIVAPADQMQQVSELIAGMDKVPDLQTHVFHLTSISPDRIDRLVKDLLGSSAKRLYQATVDRNSQSLVVSATPGVLVRIETLVKELDVPMPAERSPIRFYKLKNTKAADVLATITGLQGDNGLEPFKADASAPDANSQQNAGGFAVQNQPNANSTEPGMAPPIQPTRQILQPNPNIVPAPGSATATLTNPNPANQPPQQNIMGGIVPPYAINQLPQANVSQAVGSIHTPNATVTADVNTNSIIVIAPPAIQAMYAELIKKLDERRPQVQIECTIVTLDTSGGFQFAVDISKLAAYGSSQILTFSSFGVGSIDTTTGQITPKVNPGGTFALLGPDTANVVINALATDSRARLLSAPQLLVNDNGKGQLQSVRQEPFAEILDTNTTQSRTGLGGQAEAGTTISVESHISKGDYLQLDYSVELSNFTGVAANGLPPPSQKNAVTSSVTIPDGFTIVVGGLSLKDVRHDVRKIPLLGDIPIIKYAFSAINDTSSDTTLFVFIRPVILHDENFADLKYYSDRKMELMELPGDYPKSDPIPLH